MAGDVENLDPPFRLARPAFDAAGGSFLPRTVAVPASAVIRCSRRQSLGLHWPTPRTFRQW